jgi:Zn-dependent protease
MSIAGSRISSVELRDLFLSLAALVIAFSVMERGRLLGLETILITTVGVGTGFLLHEMAHKFVALRYGYLAEYRANMGALVLAVVMSFAGFIFAAPGAVMITKPNPSAAFYMQEPFGQEDLQAREKREMLRISLAGPMTNIVLAMAFFLLLAGGIQLRPFHQPHAGSLQYASIRPSGRQEGLRLQPCGVGNGRCAHDSGGAVDVSEITSEALSQIDAARNCRSQNS